MDPLTLQFIITCALGLAAIIAVAIACNNFEKRIDNWIKNLKDIEK